MSVRDLLLRVRALVAPWRVERELDEELAFHIARETEKHIAAGVEPAEARARARVRFGSMPLVADECRDARGITVLETIARDVGYAFRTIRRAPLAALTIVGTVGLGLALVTVVFTIYNTLFLRTDAVREPGELFAVEQPPSPGAHSWVPFTRREHAAMRRETSVFTDVVARLRPVSARLEGRSTTAALVSGNFFHVLGVEAASGRTLRDEDDEPGARAVIVLSHRGWQTLFAGDPAAVGRSVRVNGAPFEVVGVLPDGFRGLTISQPSYFAPLVQLGQFRPADAGREDDVLVEVIGRVKPGISAEAAASGVTVWASGRNHPALRGRNVPVRLQPRQGTLVADPIETLLGFAPLFFAFGLVLMIGCANVANLLLARGIARRQEIGVRLSLGASRRRIVRQLLTESMLLAAAGAVCAVIVARVLLSAAAAALMATLPPELVEQLPLGIPATDWRVLLFLAAGALVATALFALAPALQASRIEPMRTLRGEGLGDVRPGRARRTLIALQVGASALLLICAGIFMRGALASATADPGIRTSDTIRVMVANEERRGTLLQALTNHPRVAVVAAVSPSALAIAEVPAAGAAGSPPTVWRRVPVDRMGASAEYFEVIGTRLISGRVFTHAEMAADAGVAVLSETTARTLWPQGGAVGQVLRLQQSTPENAPVETRPVTVVGVVRDTGGDLPTSEALRFTGIYVPVTATTAGTTFMLRVRGELEDARRVLVADLTDADPGVGAINTLRALNGVPTYVLRVAFWATAVLGGFALLLTVSGLFSVLSYVIAQQAKDIGVRMALGATTREIIVRVMSHALVPVSGGLIAGAALAVAVATILMATPAAAQIGAVVQVLDPVAYASSALVICTACLLAVSVPAIRAARIDPVVTLRKE